MIKGIRRFGQDLDQDILFPEWPVCFTGLAVISKTVGLAQELGGTDHGNGINVVFFLQHIFYKADGIAGGIQDLFYFGNRLAFGGYDKSGKNKK